MERLIYSFTEAAAYLGFEDAAAFEQHFVFQNMGADIPALIKFDPYVNNEARVTDESITYDDRSLPGYQDIVASVDGLGEFSSRERGSDKVFNDEFGEIRFSGFLTVKYSDGEVSVRHPIFNLSNLFRITADSLNNVLRHTAEHYDVTVFPVSHDGNEANNMRKLSFLITDPHDFTADDIYFRKTELDAYKGRNRTEQIPENTARESKLRADREQNLLRVIGYLWERSTPKSEGRTYSNVGELIDRHFGNEGKKQTYEKILSRAKSIINIEETK